MIDKYRLANQNVVPTDTDPDWLALTDPSASELNHIASQYALDISDLTKVLHNLDTSHVRYLDNTSNDPIIVLQYPLKEETNIPSKYQIATYPIELILGHSNGKNCLITISKFHVKALDYVSDDSHSFHFTVDDTQSLLLAVVYELTQTYQHVINQINDDINLVEASLPKATDNNSIYHIMSLLKSVVAIQVSISSNKPVINAIIKDQFYFKTSQYDRLASLINIEFQKTSDNTNYLQKVLDSYNIAVQSIIANNSNTAMNALTVANISLAVIAMLAGVFGMNFAFPLQNTEAGFWLAVGLDIVAVFAIRHWLRKRGI